MSGGTVRSAIGPTGRACSKLGAKLDDEHKGRATDYVDRITVVGIIIAALLLAAAIVVYLM